MNSIFIFLSIIIAYLTYTPYKDSANIYIQLFILGNENNFYFNQKVEGVMFVYYLNTLLIYMCVYVCVFVYVYFYFVW